MCSVERVAVRFVIALGFDVFVEVAAVLEVVVVDADADEY